MLLIGMKKRKICIFLCIQSGLIKIIQVLSFEVDFFINSKIFLLDYFDGKNLFFSFVKFSLCKIREESTTLKNK